MAGLIVVLVVIAILVGWWLYLRSRRGSVPGGAAAAGITTQGALSDIDFKVEGSSAHVYFDTMIPAEGADDALQALMGREALRVFEEKSGHLPVEQVKHVVAHGAQGEATVVVTTVDIHRPAEMDHLDAPSSEDVVMAGDVGDAADPLATLHAMEFGRSSGYRGGTDELPPLSDDLTIPAKVVDAVAGPGGSIAGMSLEAFITGLLRTSGYEVNDAADGTKRARKGGATTYLQFVEHTAGSHPELDEGSVDGFVMKFMSSGADRGMLFTAKFGPYAIYEKERRNDKCKFMTRERLQAFVDSVAMS